MVEVEAKFEKRSFLSLSLVLTRSEMKFIADAMLGRLARWLRILGFDTLYYPDIRDSELLKLALREQRCILTRDTHFLKMKNARSICFVYANDPLEQVKEVLDAFGRQPGPGRCARCNGILSPVDGKERVKDRVPEYVFLQCSRFLRCLSCGHVYWEGTHLRRFRAMLERVLKENNDRRQV